MQFLAKLKIYWWQTLTVLILAVIFIFSQIGAFHSGQAAAKSKITVANAQAVKRGLDFFYSDQNRFPTELEFTQNEVMSHYFSFWPPADFPDKTCIQSFLYKRPDSQNYQLNVCLLKSASRAAAGWNQIAGVPPT